MTQTRLQSPASRPGQSGEIRVILVTGLSGAGKTSALKAFEDLGYEAIDNMPLSLLPEFLETKGPSRHTEERRGFGRAVAVGVDSRTRDFVDTASRHLKELRGRGDLRLELLFLTCDEEELGRRFTETRRRHPMAGDDNLESGLRREREALQPVRDIADHIFDSTAWSLNDLRRIVAGHFSLKSQPGLNVAIESFAYRQGLPRMADLVFDARFLANPHYQEELRHKDGRAESVAGFIEADPRFQPFFERLADLLESLLPEYAKESKSYLTIAFGCTGGRHRSVFVAERVATLLRGEGYRVSVQHRELADGSDDPGLETEL